MMDEWGKQHLDKWLRHEFTDDVADHVRDTMIGLYNTDSEFWGNQSYWKLYDAAMECLSTTNRL